VFGFFFESGRGGAGPGEARIERGWAGCLSEKTDEDQNGHLDRRQVGLPNECQKSLVQRVLVLHVVKVVDFGGSDCPAPRGPTTGRDGLPNPARKAQVAVGVGEPSHGQIAPQGRWSGRDGERADGQQKTPRGGGGHQHPAIT